MRAAPGHPILIDKFLDDAVEVDVDAVCDGETVIIGGVMEHIEAAGVHSGDSAMVLPAHSLAPELVARIKEQTRAVAIELGVVGLMNTLKLEGQRHNVMINAIAPMASTRLAEMTTVLPEEIMPTLRPELVTAMVAYLCSDQCRTTGDILAAGGGYYSKAQMLEGTGVRLNPAEEITAETIAEQFARITDMTEAKGYFSAADELENSLGPLLKG